jgi:hypothetical protein
MIYYLVEYTLITRYYMGDTVESEEADMTLADSPQEAEQTIKRIFAAKEEPYCVSYEVRLNLARPLKKEDYT